MADETSSVGLGTVLAGRYELTEEIGRGGFGMVYRARQLNMDRDVAVKILPPQYLNVTDVVERFKREAKLASRLRHPNTITLHDYGQHEDLLFIVMELLTGEDLADMLKREGRLAPERTVSIARQVLKSLAEAHEEKIVHRDLKPENIFLSVMGDDHDVVKVLDFGIAKFAFPEFEDTHDESGRSLTVSGSTVGTPTYMSPEQAAGEDVDGKTDLYALGIIMYEMLNGRPPFYDRDPVKVMRAHLFENVPEFRDTKLRGGLLDRVIRKALQKEREQRFNTANEFLLALAGEPVARPVVAGVNLKALDEPPTEEFEADTDFSDGPNTEDIPIDQRDKASTLQFAKAIEERTAEDDSVPFGVVNEDAPREKATVRSSLTDQSGLTQTDPPPGIDTSPSSGSSILTVIDAPREEDEVILLTAKKQTEIDDSGDSNDSMPKRSNTSEIESQTSTIPKAQTPEQQPVAVNLTRMESNEDQQDENWEWGEQVNTDQHDAVSRNGSSGVIWVILFFVALAAAVGVAYALGFLDPLLR